jgi:hypothetical protein
MHSCVFLLIVFALYLRAARNAQRIKSISRAATPSLNHACRLQVAQSDRQGALRLHRRAARILRLHDVWRSYGAQACSLKCNTVGIGRWLRCCDWRLRFDLARLSQILRHLSCKLSPFAFCHIAPHVLTSGCCSPLLPAANALLHLPTSSNCTKLPKHLSSKTRSALPPLPLHAASLTQPISCSSLSGCCWLYTAHHGARRKQAHCPTSRSCSGRRSSTQMSCWKRTR